MEKLKKTVQKGRGAAKGIARERKEERGLGKEEAHQESGSADEEEAKAGPPGQGEVAGIVWVEIDGVLVARREFFQEGGLEESKPGPLIQARPLIGNVVHLVEEDSGTIAEAALSHSIGGDIQKLPLPGVGAFLPFVKVDQVNRHKGDPDKKETEAGEERLGDVKQGQQPYHTPEEQQKDAAVKSDPGRMGPAGHREDEADQPA